MTVHQSLKFILFLCKCQLKFYFSYRSCLGVSVSGSVPKNPERMWVPGSREREPTAGSGSSGTGTRMMFCVPGSRSWEPGTHINFLRKDSKRVCEHSVVFKNR
jgi:hypothetical protein